MTEASLARNTEPISILPTIPGWELIRVLGSGGQAITYLHAMAGLICASLVTDCGGTAPAKKAETRSVRESASAARADTEPSLDQTRAWIAERLPDLSKSRFGIGAGEFVGEVTTTTSEASLDSTCTLRLDTETRSRVVGHPEMKTLPTRSIVHIPLREVDGNGVHPSQHEDAPKGSPIMNAIHNVIVPVYGGRKLIEDSSFEGRKTRRLTASQYPIPAQDQKASERIAAAVQRAVKLCGGQMDVF